MMRSLVLTKKSFLFFAVCVALFAAIIGVSADTVLSVRAAYSAQVRELPIYCVATNEKVAALGINCAWDDSGLDELLEALRQRRIKATFFMVGDWCEKYPQAAAKIAQAGHEIGSHSHTHPDMTTLDQAQILEQLRRSKQVIEETCGVKIRLFRAPSGAYNDLVVFTARQAGWEVVQWSNDSRDWQGPPPEEISARMVESAAPGDIMLFHLGKENMLPALETVVDRLTADGYRFCAIGEMIYREPYRIDHTGRQFHIGSESVGRSF